MSKKSSFFHRVKGFFFRKSVYREKKIEINEDVYLIREVKYMDIRHLIAIEKEAYEGEPPWGKGAFLSELNGAYPSLYLVVEKETDRVGFIGCRFEESDGHITNVAIRRKFQGRGLGRILLNEIEQYARANHYRTLSLEVRVSNMDAQRLYRKMGFVSRTIKKNYYHNNEEDALDMVFELEE